MKLTCIYGVDFSGAKLAGRNIWVARCQPMGGNRRLPRLRLVELDCLERLCGTAERGPALEYLVEMIGTSRGALWGIDFPFGFPIEVMDRWLHLVEPVAVHRRLAGRRVRTWLLVS